MNGTVSHSPTPVIWTCNLIFVLILFSYIHSKLNDQMVFKNYINLLLSFVSFDALKYTRSNSPALLIGTSGRSAFLCICETSLLSPTKANFLMLDVDPCKQISAIKSQYVMATSQCQPCKPGISGCYKINTLA